MTVSICRGFLQLLQIFIIKIWDRLLKEVRKAVASLGNLPQGVKIMIRGQADLLTQTMSELQVRSFNCDSCDFSDACCKFSVIQTLHHCSFYNSCCSFGVSFIIVAYRKNSQYSILHGNDYGRWCCNCQCYIIYYKC